MKKTLSGSQAVAEAVKLCEPKVVAAYPITPQTGIIETLAEMIANGDLDSEMIRVESEHSAISACIGAQATGVRTYTATASAGLALMHEMLFIASGMRMPIVMTVANRSLSAPLSIWNDQQDSFAERDSGWVQLYCENAQEAFDTHIQAFKIAEELHSPVMVCIDGYVVTHTYEQVDLLEKDKIRKFLPGYIPENPLNPAKPVTLGPVGAPDSYMDFKKQQQDTLENAKPVIKNVNREFTSAFGRGYGNGLIETVNLEGKEHALITIGSVAGTARELLEKEDIGMIRIKTLRPFPTEELMKACQGLRSIGVLEKDISLGANGALYDEVKAALYSLGSRPKMLGFIAGLGGRDITLKHMEDVMKKIKSEKESVEWIM